MKHLLILLTLFIYTTSIAQPFTLNKSIKPTELKLTDYNGTKPIEKGKITIVDVNQKDDTLYFFTKAVSILSSVVIAVNTEDKQNKLAISLHKDFWTEVDKSGTTDNNGTWITSFKTGGDIGIRIACKKSIKYKLTIWVGDEVNVDMPTPFKKYKS